MEETETGQEPGLIERLLACADDSDVDLAWLDDVPSEDVVRAILQAAEEDHSFKIDVHVSNALAPRLVSIFSEARPVLTGAEFDAAWDRIAFSMDVTVWGGDPFRPTLLPNGALLIRNHHRVLGISDTPAAMIHADRGRLRREAGRVLKQARKGEPSNAFLIHRGDSGELVRTRKLPRRLSETGQTILFVNDAISLKRMTALHADVLSPVMNSSRGGHAVLRFFGDHVFVYPIFRFEDSFDILIEEFAEAYLDENSEDDSVSVAITPELSRLQEYVSSRARSLLENEDKFGLQKKDVMLYHVHQSITAPRWGSYTGRKVNDMLRLPAVFAASPDRPPGYGEHYTSESFDQQKGDVWQLSQKYGFRAAVLFVPILALAGTHNRLEEVTAAEIEQSLAPLLTTLNVQALCAPANDLLKAPLQMISAFEATGGLGQLASRAHAAAQAALADAGEGLGEDDIKDVVRDAICHQDDYRIAIILLQKKSSTKVDLRIWDKEARLLSGRIDGSVILHVPRFGMLQSYDRGDDDSGNAVLLAVPASDEDSATESNSN